MYTSPSGCLEMVVRAVLLFSLLVTVSLIHAEEDTAEVKSPAKSAPAEKKEHVTEAKTPAKDEKAPAKDEKAPAKEAAAPAKEVKAPAKEEASTAKGAAAPAKVAKVSGAKTEAQAKVKDNDVLTLPLRMPNITTDHHDAYIMTATKVDHDDAYIVGYVPQVCFFFNL